MQTFESAKAIARAPGLMTDPQLQTLLYERVQDWTDRGLLDLTHLVIIEVGDTDKSITEAMGQSLLVNALDGNHYGNDGFMFPFDWLADHNGFFELIQTVGNDGYARFIFVRDREGVDPELLSMCRAYAGR